MLYLQITTVSTVNISLLWYIPRDRRLVCRTAGCRVGHQLDFLYGLRARLRFAIFFIMESDVQGDAAQKERGRQVLVEVLEAVRIVAVLLSPVTPTLSKAAYSQLGFQASDFEGLRISDAQWGGQILIHSKTITIDITSQVFTIDTSNGQNWSKLPKRWPNKTPLTYWLASNIKKGSTTMPVQLWSSSLSKQAAVLCYFSAIRMIELSWLNCACA